ncbi:MAG TPA: hypothetical protein VFC36_07385 [Paludibacter sp.]|nr:hypothetical protein [Paludibacter sp.]
MKYVFLIIAITLMSCKSDSLSTPDLLKGKWIEVNTKSDTLVFGLFGDQEAMMVNRGYEIRDSFRLPKHGSGPYDYRISKDKISLRSYVSSNIAYKDYTFKFDLKTSRIEVDKFYETADSTVTKLVFERLK